MKKINLFLLLAFYVNALLLSTSHSIRLQFQPDSPIDSIRVDNLDNQSSFTFTGGDALHFFFGVPTSEQTPVINNENLQVLSFPNRDLVHISFHQSAAGTSSCEVFNLHGKRVGAFHGHLENNHQKFTFVPDARGVYLVRITTPTFTQTAKFISYSTSASAKLHYDGFANAERRIPAINEDQPAMVRMPVAYAEQLIVNKNDLLRIKCYAGEKVQTIYEYVRGDKNYNLRFTEPYNHFRLYDKLVTKPGLVDLLFTVADSAYKGVDDLNNHDIIVTENDSSVSASESYQYVQHMSPVPFKIALLINNTLTLASNFYTIRQAAMQFVSRIRPNQQMAIYEFSVKPYLLQDFTADTLKLKAAVEKLSTGFFNRSDLYSAIISSLTSWTDEFSQTNLQQGAVVVFTNDNDTQGKSTLDQVLSAREQKNVYVIGLGSTFTPSLLNQIAFPKPYTPIASITELDSALAEIQADIVRYCNSFYRLNYMTPKRSGTHTLSISTKGNLNPHTTSTISGEFNANGFQAVDAGVYLNTSDSLVYGIDSLFCFYDSGKYNFTLSRYGTLYSGDSLILIPTSYLAEKQPAYVWSESDTQHIRLKKGYNSAMIVKGMGGDTLSTTLTVHDLANNYSRQLHVQLHPEKPLFMTETVIEITDSSAVLQGALLHQGRLPVLSRGLVWSTTPHPTVALSTKTNEGKGQGSCNATLTELERGTIYYVRTYATHSAGTEYSNQISFTTKALVPIPVTSLTGNVWMDINLGARRVATSSTDRESYGDLYQWGRGTDGHEKRKSPTTSTLSTTDSPGHGSFILSTSTSSYSPHNWRSQQNDNLWQGKDGVNNPCPEGYRIPTYAEWESERISWSTNDAAGALESPLKLPAAGIREYSHGYDITGRGEYWSSTVSGPFAVFLHFGRNDADITSMHRASGRSVRCIKDASTNYDLPTVTTATLSDITHNSAQSGGNVSSDGGASYISRGVALSIEQNPTVFDYKFQDGIGTGPFTSQIRYLKPGTTYYIRAYATNSAGTAYGEQFSFTTDSILATLRTLTVTEISSNSALSGGNVTADGGATVSSRGVVWDTIPTPTISLNTKTSDGSGIGLFTSTLSGFQPGTTYYVRAYATNSIGTAYGNEVSFYVNFEGEVHNAITGRIWMDRNLGASRVALSSTDSAAYGDLYQWGRGTDGHEKRNSPTTSTLSTTNTPDHGMFIAVASGDWRTEKSDNLWQGIDGINNPCPEGFRLPTSAEWKAEIITWGSISNSGVAFSSPLKLTIAGHRDPEDGSLKHVGTYGRYWSSTGTTHKAYTYITSGFVVPYNALPTFGATVRCIKD